MTREDILEGLLEGGWFARLSPLEHIIIPDVAPQCVDGDTSPGSPWWEETEEVLESVRELLCKGWTAEWSDDDIIVWRR